MRSAIILAACVLIAGCGRSATPDMKAIAAAIRSMPEAASSSLSFSGVSKSDKLEYDRDEEGNIVPGHSWMRFPAADGFVWVRIDEIGEKSSVVHNSLQFSQSGKRE